MAPSVDYLGYVISTPWQGVGNSIGSYAFKCDLADIIPWSAFLLREISPKFLHSVSPTVQVNGKRWNGRPSRSKHFKCLKNCSSSKLLVHFNPQLPQLLACDTSTYDISAMLAHKMPNGSEPPIGYVSHTLNSAERNYSQLEKEGLSCVFRIKLPLLPLWTSVNVDYRLLCRSPHLCKPLLGSANSPYAIMSMFEYTLKFCNTTAHANADALS